MRFERLVIIFVGVFLVFWNFLVNLVLGLMIILLVVNGFLICVFEFLFDCCDFWKFYKLNLVNVGFIIMNDFVYMFWRFNIRILCSDCL